MNIDDNKKKEKTEFFQITLSEGLSFDQEKINKTIEKIAQMEGLFETKEEELINLIAKELGVETETDLSSFINIDRTQKKLDNELGKFVAKNISLDQEKINKKITELKDKGNVSKMNDEELRNLMAKLGNRVLSLSKKIDYYEKTGAINIELPFEIKKIDKLTESQAHLSLKLSLLEKTILDIFKPKTSFFARIKQLIFGN
jgi:hypothetical protein